MTRARDVADTQDNVGGAVPPVVAGKNVIINGAFDIWQRGTSGAMGGSGTTYLADRWAMYSASVGTVSRQVTNDTTNLPNIQYCARVQKNSGETGNGVQSIGQSFETVNSIPFVGKTVTYSFYARKGANFSGASDILTAYLRSGTGTDQNAVGSGFTGSTLVISGSATLTTTWQRFTFTGTIGTSATQLATEFRYTTTGTAGAADYFEVTGVQLEVGSVATPFSRAGGTLQGEIDAAQRYYRRFSAGGASSYLGFGSAFSTTKATISFYTGTMRITPTALDYSGINLADGVAGTATTAASLVAATSTPDIANVDFTVASGLTQYRPYYAQATGVNSYVGFSAEL